MYSSSISLIWRIIVVYLQPWEIVMVPFQLTLSLSWYLGDPSKDFVWRHGHMGHEELFGILWPSLASWKLWTNNEKFLAHPACTTCLFPLWTKLLCSSAWSLTWGIETTCRDPTALWSIAYIRPPLTYPLFLYCCLLQLKVVHQHATSSVHVALQLRDQYKLICIIFLLRVYNLVANSYNFLFII